MRRALVLAGFMTATMAVTTGTTEAATISVENTADSQIESEGDASAFTFENFDLAGGNAVVAFVTSKGGGGEITHEATFGGQAMTEVTANEERARASIFYLINPVNSTGDLNVTLDPDMANATVSLMSLSNVLALADSDVDAHNNNSAPRVTLDYSTLIDGGFVVGAYTDTVWGDQAGVPTVSGDNDLQALLGVSQHDMNDMGLSGDLAANHLHAYGDIPTAGNFSNTYAADRDPETARGDRYVAATVAFTPIPEPASLALLGAGGLLMLARRRRAMA